MPHAFLIASCIGMVFVLNAIRPIPGMVLSLFSFFTGWLTAELAPQLLVIHTVVATSLGLAGGFHGWQGHLALAFDIAIAAGLGYLIWVGQHTGHVVEAALSEQLGPDYMSRVTSPKSGAAFDLRTPLRELILPFRMKHPDVQLVRNLSYGPHGKRNLIDVYKNKTPGVGAPIFIYLHGGAWIDHVPYSLMGPEPSMTYKDHQGHPLMLHLASRGWVCFAPNYRLSPEFEFPAHIIDVKTAIAWVREHAAEFGGDPSFVAIAGGSAGGHLSALAALTANDPEYQPGFENADTSVDACIPFYAVLDFTNDAKIRAVKGRIFFVLERLVMKQKLRDARAEFEKASPLWRAHPNAPPFFVMHGKHDSLVPVKEARHFVRRLREISESTVVYAELPGAQHAFDVFPSIRSAHVVRAAERFLDYVWTNRASKDEQPSAARRAQP